MLTVKSESSCLSLSLSMKHKFKRFKVVFKRKYYNAAFLTFKSIFIIVALKIAKFNHSYMNC